MSSTLNLYRLPVAPERFAPKRQQRDQLVDVRS
jgi:hypothetical protein